MDTLLIKKIIYANFLVFFAVIAGFFMAASAASPAFAQTNIHKSIQDLASNAISKASPAVVTVEISKPVAQDNIVYANPFEKYPILKNMNIYVPVENKPTVAEEKVGAGSGFIISHNGFVATNKHVVFDPSAHYTVVLADGTRKDATIDYRDPNNDVAILKIDGTYPAIATLSTKAAKGQPVIAIGNAFGEQSNTVTAGTISGLNRTITAGDQDVVEKLTGLVESSAPIVPGFSGGPLLDLNGNVIAINVAMDIQGNGSSFSIPISAVYKDIAPYTVH